MVTDGQKVGSKEISTMGRDWRVGLAFGREVREIDRHPIDWTLDTGG